MSIDDVDRAHLTRAVGARPGGAARRQRAVRQRAGRRRRAVRFEDRNRTKDGDETRHPEFEIARWAARHLTPDERAAATVYTSGEHCPMCSAAHAWVGLGRIVYATSSAQIGELARGVGRARRPGRRAADPGRRTRIPVDGPEPSLDDEVKELQRRRSSGTP